MILLCLVLSGCAGVSKNQKLKDEISELKNSLLKTHGSLLEKEAKIEELKELLNEKEEQLKKKDIRILQLRKKLEGFGVFEGD